MERTPRPSAACLGTLVPAYVEPQAIDDLTDGAPGPRLLIINPSNGPGASSSRAYRRAVERAQASGAHVLGYVASTFGARASSAVEADVARYRDWYGVDGIFLDEVAHDAGQLPYYEALAGAIRATGESLLVLNPGTVPARGYFALADMVVTYEGPFSDYAPRLAQEPAWVRDVPPRTRPPGVRDDARAGRLAVRGACAQRLALRHLGHAPEPLGHAAALPARRAGGDHID